MSVERVKKYLKQWNLDNEVLEFDASSATVELAARAVGCEPGMIAKTMSFFVGGEVILIVMAGDARLDNRKYKNRFHTKALMVHRDEVESMTGHPVGGVCPFDVLDGVDVYLDESLKRYDFVYPAAGSANSAVRMTLEQLDVASHCRDWIDVTKVAGE